VQREQYRYTPGAYDTRVAQVDNHVRRSVELFARQLG
jgi:hypothetical protein